MGTLFGYQGRYGAALSSAADALKTFRETKENDYWLGEILGNYGNALAQVGRSDEAEKIFDEALTVAHGLKNQALIAAVLGYKGDSLSYRGQYKAAGPFYEQALQAASQTTNAQLTLLAKVNLAKLAVKQGRSAAVVNQLRDLSQRADTMGLKYLSIQCSVSLGEALTDAKNYALAQRDLEGAVTRSEKLGLRALLAQSQFLLARTLDRSGHASDASPHYAQARQIAESIQKEANSDAIVNRSDLSPIFARKVSVDK